MNAKHDLRSYLVRPDKKSRHPTSLRLTDRQHDDIQDAIQHLADLGLPSTRGRLLELVVAEGLKVVLSRVHECFRHLSDEAVTQPSARP